MFQPGGAFHIASKRTAAAHIFNVPIDGPVFFIDPEVYDALRERYQRDTGEQPQTI